MIGLPNGWASARISDVTHRVPNIKPEDTPGKIFAYVDISSIDNSRFAITAVKHFKGSNAPSRARRPVRSNDVLFSNVRTYLRNIALVPGDSPAEICSTGFTVLRPNESIVPEYLFRYVITDEFIDRVTPQQTGTHYPATSDRVVMAQEIPLPPLNEQRRIVAKLEKLLSRVNAAQERLATIPRILKRFRQSVLAAACSGQLTISSSERRNREREHVTLKQITADLITGPFGSALHKADYVINGIPVVNPMNMVNGIIVPSEKMTVDARTREKLGRYVLREGDIVLARRGEMGRCALVTSNESGWLCGTGSAILRLNDTASPKYVKMHISSPLVREYLSEGAVGSTMANLNQNLFYAMPIELPGIDEQKEIVRRVEALFQTADALEARYLKAKAHVDRLTQSILAKAFRGELVPQDPTDEPTADLAKRIGAVKMKAKGSAIRFEITPAMKGENSRVKR